MKILLLTSIGFLSFLISADDHDNAVKNAKEKFANHPNHLLSFKDCKETKDGVGGLLELSDSVWKKLKWIQMTKKVGWK